ncbi:hypothetical protein [Chryseobacterium gleum]|uniref:hypothetical protein n=1 Tax=Chryseobacterium gleum TaxID=250 RepID=UPI00241CC3BE|nr:hypothetical protein [Chryseobacterium gleum]
MIIHFFEKIINKGTSTMFLVFLLCSECLFSQTISGIISSEEGNKLSFVNILVKENADSEKIDQFTHTKNGFYSLVLNKRYKKLYIVVNAANYETLIKEVDIDNIEKISLDFILKKEKTKAIQEVIINQKKASFEIKEDTVTYDVSKYKDPADKKVQDVLKRMPGITVNEKTGEIKYKGKSVEAVKLEGDDLFGTNYTLGTRNINVDIVEKVEAIENYSDNHLLKGIESSDKVALNLKIKKGKIDFSGNIDWASGFDFDVKQVSSINSTLLQVAKKYKSFFNLSYNNIGINQSPYDYFSNNLSLDQQKNSDYSAMKIINDQSFSSFLEDSRSNRNNAFFSSYNLIFKASPKNSTRINLSYLKDRLIQDIHNESYIINDDLNLSDTYNTIKKPELYRIEVDSKINTSKRSLLEYKLSTYNENTRQYSSVLQNGNKNFETNLSTKNTFFKQNLQFTYKLTDKSAFQFNTTYAWNDIPQNMSSFPYFNIENDTYLNTQLSNFKKSVLDFQLTYLAKYRNIKYFFSVGNIYETNKYTSEVLDLNNSPEIAYANKFNNKIKSTYLSGQANFNISRLYIQPSFNVYYQEQSLADMHLENKAVLFEPKLYLKYKISEIAFINSIVDYRQKPFSEDKLFVNPVFISNRNVISNVPSLSFQKTFNSRINYIINDLYKQLNFNFGLYYISDKGNYFSDITISPYITRYQYFYSPKVRNTYGGDFMYDKYFSFLDSVLRLNSNLSFSNYENILNNSKTRKINTVAQTYDFSWKTVFDFKVNFENKLTYNINSTQVEEGEKNTLKSFNNSFRIIAKPFSKFSIITNFEYFRPNVKSEINYFFIDNTIKYVVDRSWELSFFIKNLLNKKMITEVDINDYSVNTTNVNIIPRYFLMNITYNF